MKESIKKPRAFAFRMVLILLMFSLLLTGCRQKAKFEKGFNYQSYNTSIMLGVRSDTDLFAKDNVALDLCYGVYDLKYAGKSYAEGQYIIPDIIPDTLLESFSDITDAEIFFGLYISKKPSYDNIFPDYKTIESFCFVKEISDEEAFTEEYGYSESAWKGITYNHCETIRIPAEFFTEKTGKLVISIFSFQEAPEEGSVYYSANRSKITLEYELVDENTVRIIF